MTVEPDCEREELAGVADVSLVGAAGEQELEPYLPEAAALLVWHAIKISEWTIRRLDRCKVIVRYGVGYDNVDLTASAARGIPVCNVPDYGTEDVADHALALGLGLLRRVPQASATVRRGGWDWRMHRPVPRLRGLTAGVIGLGRIGTATALRLKAFGMDVCFHDPYLPDGADKAVGIHRCQSLTELLRRSRLVTLHCPLTDETRGLISEAALAEMQDDAVLVNTARGAVVDTVAVAAALDAGRLQGVALDVLPSEPGTDADPVYAGWRSGAAWADKVVITPHTAFYSEEGIDELRRKAARTARAALTGQPVRNVVNGVG
ncbi:MAG: C-terminal binding protein [Armatimonadetes bacterium]|nr:C-terminal binding protein [Armatimonadota bacterium]